MALALINALNYSQLQHMPTDQNNDMLIDALEIDRGSKVAMVGFIKPLVTLLESKGADVEVIDEFREMGAKDHFYQRLAHWADAALITSTTILNSTMEEILDQVGTRVRTALLGPSTPMVARAFSAWPAIRALAGIFPFEKAGVLRAVRHGLGTPHLHRHCRKITLIL